MAVVIRETRRPCHLWWTHH